MDPPAEPGRAGGRFARRAWILLDWAASAFSTVLITLVVTYVERFVMPDGAWGMRPGVVWAWTLAAAMLASAIVVPWAAAWADPLQRVGCVLRKVENDENRRRILVRLARRIHGQSRFATRLRKLQAKALQQRVPRFILLGHEQQWSRHAWSIGLCRSASSLALQGMPQPGTTPATTRQNRRIHCHFPHHTHDRSLACNNLA